jgi:hypothetical protein
LLLPTYNVATYEVQDYLIFKCILIDSMKSFIANSYFQPRYMPTVKEINTKVIVILY